MFVFPAFNTGFKKRKRTFKCCTFCRLKRIKCTLSQEYESSGCDNCIKFSEECDLKKERTVKPQDSSENKEKGDSSALPRQEIKIEPVSGEAQRQPLNEIKGNQEEISPQSVQQVKAENDINSNNKKIDSPVSVISNTGGVKREFSLVEEEEDQDHDQGIVLKVRRSETSERRMSLTNSANGNEKTPPDNNNISTVTRQYSRDADSIDELSEVAEFDSNVVSYYSDNSQVNFVSTADSLIKILNLPFTREDGSSEIRKSNSVTAFQAMSSKYIGVTDATAIFIQVAGSRKDKTNRSDSVSVATGGAIEGDFNSDGSPNTEEKNKDTKIPNYHSAAWWPKAGKKRGGTSCEEDGPQHSNSKGRKNSTGGSNNTDNNSVNTSNQINDDPHDSTEISGKTKEDGPKRKSSVLANEAVRDMLGVFVRSSERRSTPYKNAINYGPFSLPRSLFLYLKEDCNCFEIGLSKRTQFRLIKLYFKKFNSILPLLSEESSLTTFRNNHMPTLILYALILLSSRVPGAEAILKEEGINDILQFNRELEFKVRTMLKFSLDENKLTLLRTHALLSMYGGGGVGSIIGSDDRGSNGLETSSLDLTIAIHHAFTLGIHHNHYAQQMKNKRDTSISNAWWCLFIMDRMNCLINSRTMIINRKDSSLPLPIDKSLNSIVQAIIRLERVLSLYQPLGDNRAIPKDIDFDVYSDSKPIESLRIEGTNVGSECLRRLIVCITIMFAQKRKYDLLDTNSANYKQEKSIPDDLYCKSGLQILNITSQYIEYLPPINFIPYAVSFTLSAFLKIDLMSIKNEDVNGVNAKPGLAEWTYPISLEFLNSLSKQFWYAGSTYKLCAEYMNKLQASNNIVKNKSFASKFMQNQPQPQQGQNQHQSQNSLFNTPIGTGGLVIQPTDQNECTFTLQPGDSNEYLGGFPSYINLTGLANSPTQNGANGSRTYVTGLNKGNSYSGMLSDLLKMSTPDLGKLQTETFGDSHNQGQGQGQGLLNQRLEIDETLASFAHQNHFEFLATSAVKNSSNMARLKDYYKSPPDTVDSIQTSEDGLTHHSNVPHAYSDTQNKSGQLNGLNLEAPFRGQQNQRQTSNGMLPPSSNGFTNSPIVNKMESPFNAPTTTPNNGSINTQNKPSHDYPYISPTAQSVESINPFGDVNGGVNGAGEIIGNHHAANTANNNVSPSSDQSNDQLLLIFNELPNVQQFFGNNNIFGYTNTSQNSPVMNMSDAVDHPNTDVDENVKKESL